jgi:hypothetical protein
LTDEIVGLSFRLGQWNRAANCLQFLGGRLAPIAIRQMDTRINPDFRLTGDRNALKLFMRDFQIGG